MAPFVIAFSVGVMLIALMTLLVPPSAYRRRRLVDDMSRMAGLEPTAVIEEQIVRRSRRTRLFTFLGGAAGWALVVLSPLYVVSSSTGFLLVLGAVALGSALGGLTAALVDAHVPPPAVGPRIARSRAVRLADYASPLARWSGWIGALTTSIGAAACAASGVRDPLVLFALPLLVAVTAAVSSAGSRFVLTRPQTATDPLALAWDDALRAKNVTAVLDAAPLAAFYASMAVAFAVTEVRQSSLAWPLLAISITLGPVTVWVILRLVRHTQIDRHYLRRLWSDSAPALTEPARSRP